MVDQLTEEEMAECKEVFTQYDKDGDGCIATNEIGTVLRALKRQVSDAEVQDLIDEIDPDSYGIVDFSEFLSLLANTMKPVDLEEDLLEVFKVYDRDGNGYITAGELYNVMQKMGEEVTMEEVNAIISEADTDNDSQVNYKDFLRIMINKPN